MSELRTERVEQLFFSALEIAAPDERNAFLDRACAGDAGLRRVMEKMMASLPEAETFFQEGGVARLPVENLSRVFEANPNVAEHATADALKDEFLNQQIGPYRLLEKIGEGGCGAVYRAEQEKPVRRHVAFKIIKLGMDTRSVIARFEAERQALALMDHPNIARVIDAGATETGRPYFVMELVQGVKITQYCDENGLDTRQRLKLFIQVCHAIQHAHQKGVIHRDIKPSNILVATSDGMPMPKVIDFGIAKAIEGRLADDTAFTPFEHFIGTPAYMSPEQAVLNGVDVDTRSDVYSLGVLLYELLTGRTPFETRELMQSGIESLRRTLQEREPQRPSVMVTTLQGPALLELAHLRGAEPPRLISLLRGDLDWIVIRALEKDRARRYETVNGMAMDMQRFLDNEPVAARPPSRLYRFEKLVRRNKATFIAAGMVAIALITGLGVATWFWLLERDARRRAVAAEQLAWAAEQQKTLLLRESEDRERIAQAAYLLTQQKFAEADVLASKVLVLKPSLEAGQVLRELGFWHAAQGDWVRAAERFKLLLQVDTRDNSWAITEHLLMAGPILIERGDREGYEQFRRVAIARFSGTTDPVFAERTLKISLLLPVDDEVMKSLKPLGDVSSASLESLDNFDENMIAWRCISVGLMAYRQGFTPTARAWCDRCLSNSENNPARNATAHLIRAMALQQLGETDLARADLAAGHQLIDAELTKGLNLGSGANGWWFDWLFARILLREASHLIE